MTDTLESKASASKGSSSGPLGDESVSDSLEKSQKIRRPLRSRDRNPQSDANPNGGNSWGWLALILGVSSLLMMLHSSFAYSFAEVMIRPELKEVREFWDGFATVLSLSTLIAGIVSWIRVPKNSPGSIGIFLACFVFIPFFLRLALS